MVIVIVYFLVLLVFYHGYPNAAQATSPSSCTSSSSVALTSYTGSALVWCEVASSAHSVEWTSLGRPCFFTQNTPRDGAATDEGCNPLALCLVSKGQQGHPFQLWLLRHLLGGLHRCAFRSKVAEEKEISLSPQPEPEELCHILAKRCRAMESIYTKAKSTFTTTACYQISSTAATQADAEFQEEGTSTGTGLGVAERDGPIIHGFKCDRDDVSGSTTAEELSQHHQEEQPRAHAGDPGRAEQGDSDFAQRCIQAHAECSCPARHCQGKAAEGQNGSKQYASELDEVSGRCHSSTATAQREVQYGGCQFADRHRERQCCFPNSTLSSRGNQGGLQSSTMPSRTKCTRSATRS